MRNYGLNKGIDNVNVHKVSTKPAFQSFKRCLGMSFYVYLYNVEDFVFVKKLKNRQSGVTLVEVLAVVAIIGILSALGTVSFFALVEKENVRSAGATVHGALNRMVADSRKFNDTLSVAVSVDAIAGFKGSNCEEASQYFSVKLDDRTEIVSIDSDQAAPSGANAFRPGSSWGYSCLTLAPQLGLNPFTTPGYVVVGQKNSNRYRMMIYKGEQENRILTLLSNDGGSTWSAN